MFAPAAGSTGESSRLRSRCRSRLTGRRQPGCVGNQEGGDVAVIGLGASVVFVSRSVAASQVGAVAQPRSAALCSFQGGLVRASLASQRVILDVLVGGRVRIRTIGLQETLSASVR